MRPLRPPRTRQAQPRSCSATPSMTRPNKCSWAWRAAPAPAPSPGCGPPAGRLLRPFLGLRRADTLEICRVEDLEPWHDPSNTDPVVRAFPDPGGGAAPAGGKARPRRCRIARPHGRDPAARRRLPGGRGERHVRPAARSRPGRRSAFRRPALRGSCPGREVPGDRQGRRRRRRSAAQLPAPARGGSAAAPAGIGRPGGASRRGQRLPALARAARSPAEPSAAGCSPRSRPLWEACIPASTTAPKLVAPRIYTGAIGGFKRRPGRPQARSLHQGTDPATDHRTRCRRSTRTTKAATS